jgi:hypothetical protein
MTSFEVFTTHQCMPLERRDEAEELGARWRAVVWRLCGGVRGRAAWRVTLAVPGVVRKADIQFNPPRGSYLVVSGVSVDFPPDGQSQLKRRLRPPRRTEQRTHLRCSLTGPRITVLCPREWRRAQSLPATFRVFTPESFGSTKELSCHPDSRESAECAKPSICFRCCPDRYSSRDLA